MTSSHTALFQPRVDDVRWATWLDQAMRVPGARRERPEVIVEWARSLGPQCAQVVIGPRVHFGDEPRPDPKHSDTGQSGATQSAPAQSDPAQAAAQADAAQCDTAHCDPTWRWARLREIEQQVARLELERAEILGALVRDQAAADLEAAQAVGVGAGGQSGSLRLSPSRALDEARVAVTDSAITALGGSRRTWAARVRFALAPAGLTDGAGRAVTAGDLTFEQAATLVVETSPERDVHLEPDHRSQLVAAVIAYARTRRELTGAPASQQQFRARLRRELLKAQGEPARRRSALRQRAAWLTPETDGTAVFGVRGSDARCVGAFRRVDAIARALRAGGDERTLDQLRSDVALDLLIFGRPVDDAPTSVDRHAAGGWPTAAVQVVVSAASLLGLNDEPGLVDGLPVDAATVREVAHSQGSTWQRIVADPVTGYAMSTTATTLKPPADMDRAVRVRDGRCRAPGCSRTAADADLDHAVERRDGGTHSGENLQSLCRLHHSKKTRRHWRAALEPDGTVTWDLGDGRTYTTYPMDYNDLGLEAVRRCPPGAFSDRDDTDDPNGSTGDLVDPAAARLFGDGASGRPISPITTAQDVRVLRDEVAARGRETRDLRACLDDERTAHDGTRAAFADYRAAHPPF